jgi:hypothetical protein
VTKRNWIDLPFRFGSGRRAILSFEKGSPGAEIIDSALTTWQQPHVDPANPAGFARIIQERDYVCREVSASSPPIEVEIGFVYHVTCDDRFKYRVAISPKGRITVAVDPSPNP